MKIIPNVSIEKYTDDRENSNTFVFNTKVKIKSKKSVYYNILVTHKHVFPGNYREDSLVILLNKFHKQVYLVVNCFNNEDKFLDKQVELEQAEVSKYQIPESIRIDLAMNGFVGKESQI